MSERFNAWFLRNFFNLLLAFIAVSQWATLWWTFGGAALPPWVHALGAAAFYGLNALFVRGPAAGRFGRRPPPSSLVVRVYFGFAFASVFAFAFLLLAGAGFAAWNGIGAALAAQGALPLAIPAAENAVFRVVTLAGFGVVGLTFVYGYTLGQRRLRVREIAVPIRGLPAELAGVRIAQISDVHMGQNLDPEQLAGYVARINALDADLVCVTGDMIDSPRADMDLFLPIFAGLRARHGVYAILGNHDHTSGAERVAAALRRHTAITLLRDAHLPVPVRGAELHLIGLDDRGLDWARGLTHDPKLDELAARVPAGAPAVLLNHRPDLFAHAAALGIPLTLSGHTHGGQIAMPWPTGRYMNPSRFITRFDRGLYEQDGCFLYTNCGLGVTAQRVRICTPREISVFRLEAR